MEVPGGIFSRLYPLPMLSGKLILRLEILFVGAEGRMEMEKIPAAGYRYYRISRCGPLQKPDTEKFFGSDKIIKSLNKAKKVIKEFRPDVVVGVGGYASGPVLRQAGKMGIPTLIQEQNSYAGVTNKLLAKRASTICVAYDGMEKYFPEEKIIKTGNPVRQNFDNLKNLRKKRFLFQS